MSSYLTEFCSRLSFALRDAWGISSTKRGTSVVRGKAKTKEDLAGYKTRLVLAMRVEMQELRETTDRIFAQFEALAKAEGVSIASD